MGCGQCEYMHYDASKIKYHELSKHANSRNFQCDVCSKSYKSNQDRQKHFRLVHDIGNLVHKCKRCLEEFSNYRKLYYHNKRAHTEQVIHECELCAKKLRSKFNLQK